MNQRTLLRLGMALSVLSPFVFFSSALKPWVQENFLGRIVTELIYPIEYVATSASNWVQDSWDHYFQLTEASKENTVLKLEVSKLKAKLLDYDERMQEINRLRKLLGISRQYPKKKLVVAEVIGASGQGPFRTMRVGKGKNAGLSVGMPIVTADGVVGRVVRLGFYHADVQLMLDVNFNLDVLLQRTRVRGVLKGRSGPSCLLTLNRRAEIKIGDTVITSGIVGAFPKGLPVGKVVRISYESDNISQSVTVEPWVDFSRVEEVIVLLNHDPEINKILESVGGKWFEDTLHQVRGG